MLVFQVPSPPFWYLNSTPGVSLRFGSYQSYFVLIEWRILIIEVVLFRVKAQAAEFAAWVGLVALTED